MDIPKPLLILQSQGITITEDLVNAWWTNYTKICSKCKIEKPAKEFNKHSMGNTTDGLTPRCKSCLYGVQKGRQLQTLYGITEEEYLELLVKQNGRCAICKRLMPGKKRLSVDHNHQTRLIRGLLCTACNHHILGMFSEDKLEDIFRNAIEYLKNPPAPKIIGEKFAPEKVRKKRRAKT